MKEHLLRAAGLVLFGPFVLARPCGPAGNCHNGKVLAGAFLGTLVWLAAIVAVAGVIL